jgi:segregation and condensation protein B
MKISRSSSQWQPELLDREVVKGDASHQLALIEAALYVAGRPLDVSVIGSILNMRSEQKIRELARQLKKNYSNNHGALEILELSDGRYVMQLKPEFSRYVKKLATRQLLTPGPLRTLSFIASRQPITQAYVVKVRGNLAYSHVKQLREMGLIREEKLGRTKVLRTTSTFADYFNLSQDIAVMKRQLQKLFEELEPGILAKIDASKPETAK